MTVKDFARSADIDRLPANFKSTLFSAAALILGLLTFLKVVQG